MRGAVGGNTRESKRRYEVAKRKQDWRTGLWLDLAWG